MRFLVLLFFISAVSCQFGQETALNGALRLTIDQVLLPIPDDMPNDWYGVSGSVESGEWILHLYDIPKKEILQYSIEQKKLISRIAPFSDTLDPRNNLVNVFKSKDGYFLSGGTLGFLKITDSGVLIKKWDDFTPRSSKIKNWSYEFKYSLRSSTSSKLSMLNDWLIPIYIELTNKAYKGVFMEDFYQHDLFATLDLREGVLKNFPVRFPDKFYNNGLSYPLNFLPSFTAYGESAIAYTFGIDEVIHILNVETGEITDYKIPNPEFPLSIRPTEEATLNDMSLFRNYIEEQQYYIGLHYDPFRDGLLRVGIKKNNGITTRIFELLDKNMTIIAQFEQPSQYSPIPLFFPNEMWFPFQQGYAEDEMKLMRVRY
jgi:hypothetical protein